MKLSLLYLSLLTAGVLSKSDDSCSFRETRYKTSTGTCQAKQDCLNSGLNPVSQDSTGSTLCSKDANDTPLVCCLETTSEKNDLKIRQEFDEYYVDYAPVEDQYSTSASDLGTLDSANTETGYTGNSFNQGTIDQFNQNIAPNLEVGQIDNSNQDNIGIKIDPFSSRYGGRTGILVGDENFKAGVYTNPLAPQQPPVFAIEGSFK